MSSSFSLVPWLKRRGWVVLVMTGLVTVVVVALGGETQISHRGEAILLVPSGASKEGPGSAFEANRLALTYVSLIPRDQVIMGHVADAASVSSGTASRRLAVSTVGDTSLLRITYRAPKRSEVSAALRAVSDAVTGAAPLTPTIPPGTVVLASISEPEEIPTSSGGSIPVGIILGSALGFAVAVTWERGDARADTPVSLADSVSCPVSSLHDLASRSGVAVLRRWDSLANGSRAVALLGVRSGQAPLTANVARQLVHSARAVGERVAVVSEVNARPKPEEGVDTAAPSQAPVLRLVPSGAPLHGEGGESVALQSDFTVLVVPAATRLTEVRAAVSALRQFGVPVSWAVFVSRKLVRALRYPGSRSSAAGDGSLVPRVQSLAWSRRAAIALVLLALSFVLELTVFQGSLGHAMVTGVIAVTLYAGAVLLSDRVRDRRSRLDDR